MRRDHRQCFQTKEHATEEQAINKEMLECKGRALVSYPHGMSRIFGSYILMGGLAIDVNYPYNNDKVPRMTLKPIGVFRFAGF